ncbi:ArsI/CadI family heavy metal resistance metalloenzyme [Pontibacter harenae]|uniref:ArsI/CadI family heavy metal resistance metalloenzyme n=1 Tax=Pontibacter harenae TaxID=2894083 RepID=UPI001E5A12C2|nr:ArsI/CadI family heavy metal resistance metalloenzyme [Pontibacter harenae]MCC9167494.1 VOC family protein [Pontibacter harenae]
MSTTVFPRMHVSLYVTDIAKTTAFYTSFFGQEPAKVKPRYAKYVLDQPSLIISFVENPERMQQNFGHLGFQVETKQELEERLLVARAQELVSKEEIGTACCYAVQDKFWVTDPDGVQWEIYYFHEDAEFNDPHYELNDASACCMPAAHEEKPKVQLASIGFVNQEEACCTPGSGCC